MAESTRKKKVAARRDTAGSGAAALESRRMRQASVAAVLDNLFGPFGDMSPELWDRRAYLLLVGSVYERLATDEEVSTDELVKLARVLAEHRRLTAAAAQRLDQTPDEPPTTDRNGRLPDRFAELIRDVYGTQVEAETAAPMTQEETGDGAGG